MPIKVSIIVPIFNAEKYLRACLDSIAKQTINSFEVIMVDDGSTDGSRKIIENYAQVNPFFKVIYNKEKNGVKAARACGLRNASGEYIGWVDADDIIEPQMFEILYDNAIRENADLVYCNYDFIPRNAKKEKWAPPYYGRRDWQFLERNTIHWNTLMSAELLRKIDYPSLLLEVSEYAKLSLLLRASKIVYVDKELYHYRVGHVSTSKQSYKGRVEFYQQGVLSTKKLKEKVLYGSGYEKELEEYFDYRLIYKYLLVAIVAAYNKDQQAYDEAVYNMKKLHYKKNKYTKLILSNHYGCIKAFVLYELIPMGYYIAAFISKGLD